MLFGSTETMRYKIRCYDCPSGTLITIPTGNFGEALVRGTDPQLPLRVSNKRPLLS
jgi:hypothetical protein